MQMKKMAVVLGFLWKLAKNAVNNITRPGGFIEVHVWRVLLFVYLDYLV